MSQSDQRGYMYGVMALTAWGLLPLYWKMLAAVPSTEVIAHRAVWSALFLLLACSATSSWAETRRVLADRRKVLALCLTGTLIATNWLVYVWGVAHNHLMEASLGYFLSPLVSVALGAFFLGEELPPYRRVAVLVAALGVLCKALAAGVFPWVGISLAITMSLYGFIRKKIQVSSLVGLTLETCLLSPFALFYLGGLAVVGASSLTLNGALTTTLLVVTGVATSCPLLWFVRAGQLLPLSTLGILQYLSPTLQFLLAIIFFGEPLTIASLASFCLIWVAVVVYLFGDYVTQAGKQVSRC
jgi:chloramphenicol-sensitive protein RarD